MDVMRRDRIVPDRLREIVGENMRDARLRLHLTQEFVADCMVSAGYPWVRATVTRIESGRRQLATDELLALVMVLPIEASDILRVA